MEQPGSIAMTKRVAMGYDEALPRVKAALKEQGFGVLTEVDVAATLKEKIDVDFRRYAIIGACNPPLAHRALQGDLSVGLLLPCNVVVYEDGDGCVVSFFDPEVGMAVVDSPALTEIAHEAKERLERALAAI
jgi:uncharacterized protein (DUF302 family)